MTGVRAPRLQTKVRPKGDKCTEFLIADFQTEQRELHSYQQVFHRDIGRFCNHQSEINNPQFLAMDSRTAYIALNMMADIGPVSVRALVTVLGSPQAIFQADKGDLLKAEGIGPALVEKIVSQRGRLRPDEELARARKLGYDIITPADVAYPKPLLTIHDPPLAICAARTSRSDEAAVSGTG